MLRAVLAVLLGLFITLTEIFTFKDFEVPALPVDYYPSTRKKTAAHKNYPALRRVL